MTVGENMQFILVRMCLAFAPLLLVDIPIVVSSFLTPTGTTPGGGGGGDGGGGGGPRPWHPAVFVMDSKRILCIIWTLLSFAALFSMWASTRCKRLNLPRSLVVHSHGMTCLTYESQSLNRICLAPSNMCHSLAPSLATTGAKVQLTKLFKLVTSLPLEGRVKEIVTRLNSRTIAAQDAGAR